MKKINIILIIVLTLAITSTLIFFNRNNSSTVLPISQTSTEIFSTSTYKYTNFFDWPPEIETLDKEYSCVITSTTTEVTVSNNKYCKSMVVEGAAGSTYTTYAYSFARENKTVSLTFNTRQPQCMNYDNPKQTECLDELKNVDVDKVVDDTIKNMSL